jgi:hypothetical protein
MAIPKFFDDLNIIARLGNKPGTDDGLSPEGFKSKFDEGILKIQNYINNVLIPGIENSIDEDGLLSKISTALSGKLSLEGGGMRGPLNMNFEILSGIETPKNNDHAANKEYVDEKRKVFTTTLTANNWTGNTAPYTQRIGIEGILSTDRPHVCLIPSDDSEVAVAQEEHWGLVNRGVAYDSYIVFTCYEDRPETNLTLQIEVNR